MVCQGKIKQSAVAVKKISGEIDYDIKGSRTSSTPVPDSFCCHSTLLANQKCDDTERKVALPRYPVGYTLVEQVGIGGMSVVFRAFQHGTERECAIKYVDRIMNPGSVERLEREVRAIAAIEHPNVIKIIACNLTDSIPNFVMEYAGGGTLSEQIEKSQGGLPIEEAVAITEIVARVMAIAHEKGVIHRDLKPGNILLDSKGEIKIADFGLSRNLETDPAITKPGAIIGTPSFMSPEQAAGMPATRASDIYGTGAILYNLLTGQPPFRQRDQMRTIESVIRETPIPPRAIRREIPAELEAICLKALEKAPSDRYGSEYELAEDLARFRIGTRTKARPRTVACKCWNDVKKHSQWLATAAVILIATTLATIVWPERPRKRMTQEELTVKIRSGKPVTIANASELLVEPYWMFESAEMKKPKEITAFSILSSDSAGLGLVRNPGVDSYRITCEMRQHQLASYLNPAKRRPEKFDRLGLMFGNVELPLEQASAHISTCISFSEFFAKTPCNDQAERNQFSVHQMAYITQPLHPGHLYQMMNYQMPITPPATLQPEWRKLTIEINPRRIVVRNNDQLRTISSDEIVTSRKRLCEKLCQEYGTVSFESMDWSPRQEIGLWVSDSWSGLRNFEIESMQDGE